MSDLPLTGGETPKPITREEYREANGLPDPSPIPEPGFIAKSRKAIAGAVSGLAVAVTPLIVSQTSDGVFTSDELMFTLTVGAGAAVVGFLSVWYVPNASRAS